MGGILCFCITGAVVVAVAVELAHALWGLYFVFALQVRCSCGGGGVAAQLMHSDVVT
jgi:hypothetical protein